MGIFFKGTKEERQQKREELRQNHQEKINQNKREFEEFKAKHEEKKAKIEAEKLEIHRKYEAKRLGISLKLPQYGVTLDHFSGLPDVAKSTKIKVEADSKEQCLKIAYSSSAMRIPYADIISSALSTDVEVPQDDYETKYMFYIHIRCRVAGNEKELVFSNFQDKSTHIRDIIGLDYILNHLDVKIEEFENRLQDIANWNAKYDRRNVELKAERERLLNKRGELIDKMRPVAGSSNVKADNSAPSSDPAAELRRFKSMLEEGLITQEDFDIKKKQLLGL